MAPQQRDSEGLTPAHGGARRDPRGAEELREVVERVVARVALVAAAPAEPLEVLLRGVEQRVDKPEVALQDAEGSLRVEGLLDVPRHLIA
jgi:hypothetical protein